MLQTSDPTDFAKTQAAKHIFTSPLRIDKKTALVLGVTGAAIVGGSQLLDQMKAMLSTICAGLLLAGVAWADDGIVSTHREAIQAAMGKHIQEMIEMNGNGKFPMFDPNTRTVVQLTFKEFHDSVEIRGRETPYFVSCSDFVAEDGTLYDIDFVVSGKYGVVTSIVHAKDGRHKAYEVR